MFYSLVLLIKTINTYDICILGYVSFTSRNIDKKNNWLRLRWLRQKRAEAETETSHFAVAIIDHDCCHKNMCIRFEFGKREANVGFKVILHHIVRQ